MTKHHWRQQIKSFFDHHADPDKHEHLKQSRKDMEEKKDKIIKLIKAEQQDGSNGKTESLEELINDYHKQYESLYEEHLNLTGELKKKAHRKNKDQEDKGKKSSSSSSSDSDSDSEGITNVLQQRIIELENENAELRTKMVDLELNLRSSERKVDELSRGNNQSHDHQLVVELQTTIEDLKRDLEMDKDELTTIEEKNRNLEVMLRLSNQKKRVTEQILSEKEERNVALSQTVQEYSSMIRDMSEKLNGSSLGEVQFVVNKKFEEDYGELVKSVVALCKEVESVRSRVAVSNSEKATRKEKEEMEKVVKEKDERIMILGEEKREAIRQLCAWNEYYRSRCEELRGVLLKIDPQAKNATTLMK